MARRASSENGAGETRERILRHALRVFSEKGFDGASTREIASSASVNHGLIPYYFQTKERMWKEAVDLAFSEMKEGIETLLADPSIADDRERTARMIRAHVRFTARHPEWVRLMHEEGKRKGPRTRWIVDRHVRPLYEVICALLERSDPRIDIPPLHFFYVMAGAVGLLFHQAEECRRLTGVDPFDPEVIEEHARVVERLLLGTSGARPGS